MEIGLLWFDNDKKSVLSEKVARAAEHYRQKYQREPRVCFVHPMLMPEGALQVGSVRVEPGRTVLKHHFWLGEEGE